ncbi:TPA: elongation factor P [Candidatus Poribacteria bacterium]|nr:elongation factor P [Candidatus Poribacteria bacterium]
MASLNDLRNGLIIRLDENIYTITNCEHIKPGKGGAFARTKIKRLTNGAVVERTFRTNDTIEVVRLEDREMQYMYTDGNLFYFMDSEVYEEFAMSSELIGDAISYLKEGLDIIIRFDGDTPVVIELPTFVALQIVETELGVRGDTVSGSTKPATLETGLVIQVPLFVENKIIVKIDTRTGEYIERL